MDLQDKISKKISEIREQCRQCKFWDRETGCGQKGSADNPCLDINKLTIVMILEDLIHG